MEARLNYAESKHSFFKEFPENKDLNKKINFIKDKGNDYTYIARNLKFIEQDSNSISEVFKNDKKNHEKYWYYYYYCCLMLQYYYEAYEQKESEIKYRDRCKEIEAYLRKDNSKSSSSLKNNDNYITKLGKIIAADLSALITMPLHSNEIKKQADTINMMRLQLVFSKLFVRQSVVGFKETQLISKLLGGHAGNRIITNLDKTTGVFNMLSVGLFVVHFAMDAGELLKHTFINPENSDLTLTERFTREFNDRHCSMINDLVWATVNGVTNYASYFNISAPVANWTMAGFVLFDISFQYYKHQLAYDIYNQKKNAYAKEKLGYADDSDEVKFIVKKEKILEQQWKVTEAKLYFNLTGAFLLLNGLSASLILTAPSAGPIGFLMCTLAFAMFQSDKKYGEYKSKQFLEEKDGIEGKDVLNARNDLLLTVTKNTVVPIGFMGLFAVSWPAALLLTVLYTGCFDYHQRACEDKNEVPGISPS